MPLYIKDDATSALVGELAQKRSITKQAAVQQAVSAELARMKAEVPLRQRLAMWRLAHPLPAPTGLAADKAFFDDLSGGL